MRALAPPPNLPQNASASDGATLFASLGCAGCHTPRPNYRVKSLILYSGDNRWSPDQPELK